MNKKIFIDRLLNKDRDAQKEIIISYNSRLFTYFKIRIKGEPFYEDLVQEVFASFFEGVAKEKVKEDVFIAPYMFGIAKRVVFNYFYKKKKKENIQHRASEEFSVSYDFMENARLDTYDFIQSLKKHIEKLKEIDKIILKEFYFKEKTLDEISELTKKTKHYISVRKERLLKKLREKITDK